MSGRPAAGLFPPRDPARARTLELLHQPPAAFGVSRSRWTLAALRDHAPALAGLSLSAICRRLKRWQISRKRGRHHVTSPDPEYAAKMRAVARARRAARRSPSRRTFLYGDEKTLYRQPSVGAVYHERGRGGRHQAKATRSHRSNAKYRLAGALDAVTGQHHVLGRDKLGIAGLRAFLRQLRGAYGPGRELTLAWDNWPVHKHPEVEAEARAQGICLLYLPTYAPWTNPEEKVWRKLEEERLRMHRLADDWAALKAESLAFLRRADTPSPELLRYVGL